MLRFSSFVFLLFWLAVHGASSSNRLCGDDRPNILWIIVDDMSANFSCYGERAIETPNVDALSRRGTLFKNAFVTAPVCSTCRSAFITGMYQTSIGAHHHRSGRGVEKIRLPEGVTPVPSLFQKAGYYTSISSWPIRKGRLGKTDYNFEWNKEMYDGPDWTDRKPGQPFFAQIQTPGGKLRGASQESYKKMADRARKRFGNSVSVSDVKLPPYYPKTPIMLMDWAAYLDSVRETDAMVGEVLQKLKMDGDLDNTIVLFMTDHGISHARGKQYLYDEGIHVPLVVAGPGIPTGQKRLDLVEHIDIAAISLAAAGIDIPRSIQAQNVFAVGYKERAAIFAARDRCDETVDHIRCVRTSKYKYIRNYLHMRPHFQPNAYKDNKAILIALRKAAEEGRLNKVQKSLLASTRPKEELYDLKDDPHEINNLADSEEHLKVLKDMRHLLQNWETRTGDQGRSPETDKMFDSDMDVYLNTLKRRKPERLKEIEKNIQLMKKWAKEGK